MKKLFLLVSVISLSLFINSCGDDDSNPLQEQYMPTSISYKVNDGEIRTTTNADITVTQDAGGPKLQVVSTINANSESKLFIEVYDGDTGTGQAEVAYFGTPIAGIPAMLFDTVGLQNTTFLTNVTRNDSEVLSGTFSGILWYTGNPNADPAPVLLTEGSFYINK
jgi:hypothetical protein